MKKNILIVAILFINYLSYGQSFADVSFAKLEDSPLGFIDVEVKLGFIGTPDAIGNCNFFFTIDPGVLGEPTIQSLGILSSPYTNSLTPNGGGVYSYNVVLPSANNGTGNPIINSSQVAVGVLRFPLLVPATGTTPIDLDEDFTEIFDDGDPSQPVQIPLGSSPVAIIPLPIKLRNFTVGKFGNERISDLRWSSSSEINSDYFDVERSEDGFTFISIGQQDATGNSSTEQNYAMLDRSLPNSRGTQDVFYYRLKMVDLDGKYEYSDVRSIRFDNENNIDVVAYPNPTSGKLFVNISTPDYDETLSTNAFIYDLSGKLVNKSAVSTKGITEINLDNITNGAYNIIISHNGTSYQNRIIKTN